MRKKLLIAILSLIIGCTEFVGYETVSAKENYITTESEETTKNPIENNKEEVQKADVKPTFEWSTQEFVKDVPLPNTDLTFIETDANDKFEVLINGNEENFKDFVDRCKEAGFVENVEESEEWLYIAYDKHGTKLSTKFDKTRYALRLEMTASNKTLKWPTIGIIKKIPTPESTTGVITNESSELLYADIGNISKEQFDEYVNECIASGFEYDYQKSDAFFSARNKDGDSLILRYESANTMHISLTSAKEVGDGWTAPENASGS